MRKVLLLAFLLFGLQSPVHAQSIGVPPVATLSGANALILKPFNTNLYGFQVSVDSTISASDWWIMVFNATAIPSAGAVTPIKCYRMLSGTASFYSAWPNSTFFSNGAVIAISTTGCFTLTYPVGTSTIYISGEAQ